MSPSKGRPSPLKLPLGGLALEVCSPHYQVFSISFSAVGCLFRCDISIILGLSSLFWLLKPYKFWLEASHGCQPP